MMRVEEVSDVASILENVRFSERGKAELFIDFEVVNGDPDGLTNDWYKDEGLRLIATETDLLRHDIKIKLQGMFPTAEEIVVFPGSGASRPYIAMKLPQMPEQAILESAIEVILQQANSDNNPRAAENTWISYR